MILLSIAALERPDEGTIEVLGHELRTEHNLDHYRARDVGMVFQLDNLITTLNASENVQVPMFESGRSAGERRRRALELLEIVGLNGREKNRPAELSGGERSASPLPERWRTSDPAGRRTHRGSTRER
jgi:putative ABC transport system ATP-binding protein